MKKPTKNRICYRTGTRIIAMILAFLCFFYVVPSAVIAEAAGELVSERTSQAEEAAEAVALRETPTYEVVELREADAKYFHLADGSYVAAHYSSPVHYEDENGALVDINNALSGDGSYYTNENARIKLVKKITGNGELFTLKDGSTKLTLSLIGAKKGVLGSVTNNTDAEDMTELQKMLNLEGLSSGVTYSGILDGVDLQYVVHSLNVKENIIVYEKSESYSYSFELKLNGLTAALDESGDVLIYDAEGLKYTVPAPVVNDAAYEICPADKSYYTLEGKGNGKYVLTVTVDSDWMNAKGRAFPVTVDPAIETVAYENIKYVDGTVPVLQSGEAALWKINELPTLPAGAYLSRVKLSLPYANPVSAPVMAIYEVLSDAQDVSLDGVDISSDAADFSSVSNAGDYTWDITSLMNEWYNDPESNNGIAIMPLGSEGTQTSTLARSAVSLNSTYSTASEPTITFEYNSSLGLEDYYSYSSHSVGVAGNGNVKLNDGTLITTIPTLSTTDSIMPYTPTLVYNSVYSGLDYAYPNATTPSASSYMPLGFKLNISETVVRKSYSENGQSGVYYVYSDADGTEHIFYKWKDGWYSDEDGLHMELSEYGSDQLFIIESDRSQRIFTKKTTDLPSGITNAWYLTALEDRYGNKVEFTYDSSYRPTAVSVKPYGRSAIVMLNLYYYSTGKLRMIYNSASKDAVVFRYSSTYRGSITTASTNYLRRIDYAQGSSAVTLTDWESFAQNQTYLTNITLNASAEYSYLSNGKLTLARDNLAGQRINYLWMGQSVTRISEYGGQTLGQQLSLTYAMGFTEIRATGNDEKLNTSDDILARYAFDDKGRTASTYSCAADGTEIYGGVSGEYETQESAKNSLKQKTTLGGSAVNYLLNGSFEKGESYWQFSGSVSTEWSSYFSGEGNQCAEFTPSNGAIATVSQRVSLGAGEYTLSMPYMIFNSAGAAGTVSITSVNGSGFSHISGISLSENESTGTKSTFSTSFKLNSSDVLSIEVKLESSAGTTNSPLLQIDRVMLENNVAHSGFSLVSYGSFDSSVQNSTGNTIALSDFWTSENSEALTIVTDESTFGKSVKLTSNSAERYVKQRAYEISSDELHKYDTAGLEFVSNAGQDYILSGFAKAVGAIQTSDKFFRLRADVVYYQGSGKEDVVKSYSFDFSPTCETWQFTGGYFTTEYIPEEGDTNDYSCVRAIDVYCEYTGQANNYALFDNVSLVNCDGKFVEKYGYYPEDSGVYTGLLWVKETYGYGEYYEYNSNKDIIRIANNEGKIYDYFYNGEKVSHVIEYNFTYNGSERYPYFLYTAYIDLVIEKTPVSRTDYSYNSFGQCTYTNTYPVNANGEKISGENEYPHSYYYQTSAGSRYIGALLSETDSMYVTIGYYYDESDGSLLARFNKSSCTGVAYSYDAMGRLVGVRPATYSPTTEYQPVEDAESVSYTYNSNNLLSSIATESTVYNITYDAFGNTTGIEAGDKVLAEYTYAQNNGKLSKITYGNGFAVEYVYNTVENLSEIWYNISGTRTKAYSYEYTASGLVSRYNDHVTQQSTVYSYDAMGKLIGFVEFGSDELVNDFSARYYYVDDKDRLNGIEYRLNYLYSGNQSASSYTNYSYSYDSEDKVTGYYVNGISGKYYNVSYVYDAFDRVTGITYSYTDGYTNNVTKVYRESSGNTSGQIEEYVTSVNGGSGRGYSYYYSVDGNIVKVIDSADGEIRYQYDDIGQLVREDNTKNNETYVYTYDNAGNITSKKIYTLTAANSTPSSLKSTYSYGYSSSDWGDLLTSYRGTTITYDGIGNPLSYYNGESYVFTWNGRDLATATKGGKSYSFVYNDNGVRIQKTVNGVATTYYVSGSEIVAEETAGDIIAYYYGADGTPIGYKYHSATSGKDVWEVYFFERNAHGDIIAVYGASGTKYVSYSYDAWGNATVTYHNGGASTSAAKNPFRYRGYYYDQDLGLYYNNTRYYDSKTCRWINADKYASTGQGMIGYNMFVYCGNNPIMLIDPTGEAWWHWAIGAAVVVACAVAVVVTAGGAAAGIAAVSSVASGVAATTTASTIAAGAFIGASVAYGSAALITASTVNSAEEFAKEGDWGTVIDTTLGAVIGGTYGYHIAKIQLTQVQYNPGKDFQPNGPNVQLGVNPNTLTPTKDLSTLSPYRMNNAFKYGGNQAISVTNTGVILDGHHRVAHAIKNGQMVDVIVEVFK